MILKNHQLSNKHGTKKLLRDKRIRELRAPLFDFSGGYYVFIDICN